MTERQLYEIRSELCDVEWLGKSNKVLRHPDDLEVGERVQILGFQDDSSNGPIRYGTVESIMPHFIRIRFDAGYAESWNRRNLIKVLNGHYAGGGYTSRQRNRDDMSGAFHKSTYGRSFSI